MSFLTGLALGLLLGCAVTAIGLYDKNTEKCTWAENEDMNDNHFICNKCGLEWTLTDDGTPFEHGMNFCPGCGADITAVITTQYDSDSDEFTKTTVYKN